MHLSGIPSKGSQATPQARCCNGTCMVQVLLYAASQAVHTHQRVLKSEMRTALSMQGFISHTSTQHKQAWQAGLSTPVTLKARKLDTSPSITSSKYHTRKSRCTLLPLLQPHATHLESWRTSPGLGFCTGCATPGFRRRGAWGYSCRAMTAPSGVCGCDESCSRHPAHTHTHTHCCPHHLPHSPRCCCCCC
jgi:hypothetical protein